MRPDHFRHGRVLGGVAGLRGHPLGGQSVDSHSQVEAEELGQVSGLGLELEEQEPGCWWEATVQEYEEEWPLPIMT